MEKQGGSCLRAFFSPRSIMTSMRSVPRPDAIMIFLISSHLWVAFRSILILCGVSSLLNMRNETTRQRASVVFLAISATIKSPVDRQRVASGKSVSVRVDLGGGGLLNKKNKTIIHRCN